MRVAVIGGGINGFSCAVQILEHFKDTVSALEVTVISEAFTPNTTGDGSAGLWGPFLLGNTPTAKIHKWSKVMHDFLEKLWQSEDAGEAGICLIPVVRLTKENAKLDDFWKDIVYGCVQLTQKQLEEYNVGREQKFTLGLHFVTYTSEPKKLLPYLMKRFQANGGKIVQQKVQNLKKFVEGNNYDVIINCTGLGSNDMLNDKSTYPVRGQVSRVKANWIYYVLLDESDDGNYIIPNTDSVVLGGTHQHDYSTKVSKEDKEFILNGCKKILPALENAQHLCDWVGLRPGRDQVRLEIEKEVNGDRIVIHNYGHGGSGVTLSWGCAADVLDILKTEINNRKLKISKL